MWRHHVAHGMTGSCGIPCRYTYCTHTSAKAKTLLAPSPLCQKHLLPPSFPICLLYFKRMVSYCSFPSSIARRHCFQSHTHPPPPFVHRLRIFTSPSFVERRKIRGSTPFHPNLQPPSSFPPTISANIFRVPPRSSFPSFDPPPRQKPARPLLHITFSCSSSVVFGAHHSSLPRCIYHSLFSLSASFKAFRVPSFTSSLTQCFVSSLLLWPLWLLPPLRVSSSPRTNTPTRRWH